MWSRPLTKYSGSRFTNYLASELADWAKNNLITSTNIDRTPMVTNKLSGKPLIDTGRLLNSITVNNSTVRVNVPYAAEVQKKTGNYFIGVPPSYTFNEWVNNYEKTI